MRILGLSAFYHDSAAALVEGGRIVAAAQEERFTRRKHDSDYPANAIACCLEQGGIVLDDVDRVAFYDKPFLKFERLLETYVALAPRGFRSFRMAVPVWIKEKLFQKDLLRRKLRSLAAEVDWESKLLVRRAPSIACGERVLSVAVPRGGGADDGRGRRVGHHLRRHRPAATIWR